MFARLTARPDVAGYALAALVVIAVVVLSALHADIPAFLIAIGLAAAGGGAGAAVQTAPTPAPPLSMAEVLALVAAAPATGTPSAGTPPVTGVNP
jgi:hypothetical protein